jgi:glycosyltransferase involved in cell wall biosynthesis
MRILHVIDSLDPRHGGPPMIAFRLAAAQASLGHDVHIATRATPHADAQIAESLRDVPHAQDVRRHHISMTSRVLTLLSLRTRRDLAALVKEADFVHLHAVWEPLVLLGAAEARRQGRPYCVLLNGMLDPWSLAQRRMKKRMALALCYRRMLNGAAFLHLGNEDERRLIASLQLESPGVILPNGVFLEELASLPAPDTFHKLHAELRGRPYVLFLGRLHYKKGLSLLAEAFAQVTGDLAHRDLQLVVAGPDGGAEAPLKRQVAHLGIADRVHIIGPLFGPNKLAALTGAACFCLPSHQEGFSMAITEALACRVPVVISVNCHFPEVEKAKAGFVVPLEPRALADALHRVTADDDLRQRMGRNGRALVASRYVWQAIASASIEAYRRASTGVSDPVRADITAQPGHRPSIGGG